MQEYFVQATSGVKRLVTWNAVPGRGYQLEILVIANRCRVDEQFRKDGGITRRYI
jgi:hypothetical protein